MASNVSDEAFAQAVSEMGIVSPEQLEAAKAAQARATKQGVKLSLADSMLLKGLLTPAIRENIEKKLQAADIHVAPAAPALLVTEEDLQNQAPPTPQPTMKYAAPQPTMKYQAQLPTKTIDAGVMDTVRVASQPPPDAKFGEHARAEAPDNNIRQYAHRDPGAVAERGGKRDAHASARPKARTKGGDAKGSEQPSFFEQNRNMAIGGGAFLLLLIVLGIAALMPKKDPIEKKPVAANQGDPKNPSAVKPPEPAKVNPDVEPTDPEGRKKWMIAQYEKFERANMDSFGELIKRLETMEKAYEKDDNWVAQTQGAIKAVKLRAEKKAGEMAESYGAAAMKKADSGDFKGAMAELEKFPDDLARTEASTRIFFFRRKLQDKAQSLLQTVDAKAQALVQSGDYAGAEHVYDGVATFGYSQLEKQVNMRRAEIRDVAKRGVNPSQGKSPELSAAQKFFGADVYAALPEMIPTYDSAFHEAAIGNPENAKSKINLAEYPRSAVFYYAQALLGSRQGGGEDAQWNLAQATRLALPDNSAFRSRLLCVEARMSLTGGDFQTVQRKTQEALTLDPSNPDAHFVIANMNFYMAEMGRGGNQYVKMGWESLRRAAQLDRFYARVSPELENDLANAPDKAPDKYQYSGTGGNPYLVSVVRVFGFTTLGQAHGTGWAVKSTPTTAYIITNHHVIKDLTEIAVTYQFEQLGNLVRKESKQVKVLQKDADNDLALLEVQTEKEIKALPMRPTTRDLMLPMKLTLIGHPKQLDFTVMSGELANLNRIVEGKRMLQTNANVDSGMSGGPVIDETGHVIGVTVAKFDARGQGLAILSEHVQDICAKAGITVELKTPKAGAAATPEVPKSVEIQEPKKK